MAHLIVHEDGRREIISKKTPNKNRRRATPTPPVDSNNRAAKRDEMSDTPAAAKIGPNNARAAGRRAFVHARFS